MNRRVVHANVRQGVGGAAKVAMALAHGMEGRGWDTSLYYGYGPRGLPEPTAPTWCVPVTSRYRAASNLAAHKLLGRDLFAPPKKSLDGFIDALHGADVIHLHALHSHWLPLRTLKLLFRDLRAPVVWTMHDHWALTGRCAQPGPCSRWATGCGACPQRMAYPGGRIDWTRGTWPLHRELLHAIPNLTVVSCAAWFAAQLSDALPALRVRHIKNGTDFTSLSGNREHIVGRDVRVLAAGADLSSSAKQDLSLLSEVAGMHGIQLVTAGARSPFPDSCAENHGLLSRDALAALFASVDVLLFTSRVDYYPLILIEALAAGVPIIAYDSPAAAEILGPLRIPLAAGRREARAILAPDMLRDFVMSTRRQLETYKAFTTDDMVRAYATLYDELLTSA